MLEETGQTYAPDGTLILLPYQFYPKGHFVNITVTNEGKEIARNCEVKLRLLNRTEGCQWLSDEEKSLTWDDRNNKISIRANDGKASFHLAFSQEIFTNNQRNLIGEIYCGVVKDKVRINSWVGTKDALNTQYRDQDGLCQGEFNVHIEIAEETGEKASKDFIIKVGKTWKELDAELVECKCDPS